MKVFTGCCTALITPFNEDKKVDFYFLDKLISFQTEKGADAVLLCGTTGEASTLDDEEHLEVLRFCRERTRGKIPFIAGTGSNNTSHAVYMSKEAENLGADAVLLVTPYYNKCSEEGLYRHFKTIAESVSLPCILYNVPSRTGVDLKPKVIERLCLLDNIAGVKEASGKIERVKEIKKLCGSDFPVYSGNDDITLDVLDLGGDGVISVVSNVLPKETALMTHLYSEGKKEEAKEIFNDELSLIRLLFSDVNPIPVKAALSLMGLCKLEYRLPLCEMSPLLYEKLKEEMSRRGLLNG